MAGNLINYMCAAPQTKSTMNYYFTPDSGRSEGEDNTASGFPASRIIVCLFSWDDNGQALSAQTHSWLT